MTGSGTENDPYIISDVDDLQAMNDDLAAYYELGGDIDASATVGWNAGAGFIPIGPYAGTGFLGQLDGKGYTIDQLFINRATDYIGLFACTWATTVVIKNVKMTNVNITGREYVGALVGYHYWGTVSDCSATGAVKSTGDDSIGGLFGYIDDDVIRCWSTCTVSGGVEYVGGLIGYMDGGYVDDCYATGSVSGVAYVGGFVGYLHGGDIDRCYATGNVVSSDDYAGGFVGYNWAGYIYNSYARGDATAANDHAGGFIGYNDNDIDGCYSTGTPSASSEQGGFCGENDNDVDYCFWDTEASGEAVSDGGTGKTTAEMKTQSTFTDEWWDFDTIWLICSGVNDGYPCLLGITPSCVATIPTVTTNPATLIEETTATLNGTLDDDGGQVCDCGFEYGETTDYGTTTSTESKETGEAFSQALTGLTPGKHYHFRAIATNSGGTTYGSDRGFFAKGGYKGNPNIDQRIYQHVERMGR